MNPDTFPTLLNLIGHVLSLVRFNFTTEAELQAGVCQALTAAELPFEREKRLDAKNRLDFYIPTGADSGIALETKINGSLAQITRQLHRYAQCPNVRAIVLLSRRSNVADLPDALNNKPLRIITLWSQGL